MTTLKFYLPRFTPVLSVITFALVIPAVAQANITPPDLNNRAYVLMDYDTGAILAQKNADTPLPPASLTKMMTSYIIEERLESGDLKEDEPVLMSENAWCRGSSSQSCMYVPVNTTATALDMLKGIIIQSGNDASKAMAEHIAGSEEAFAQIMNDKAKNLGMTHTHFKNATGMPAPGHAASALDLAKLAQAIIKNSDKYYAIYSEKEFTYNNITQGNRNALLMTDPSVDGLKTGHTNAAGYCLVASSQRNNMRLISVIMGADSMQARADQSRKLLNWGFGHFSNVVVAPANKTIASLPVYFGKTEQANIYTQNALRVLTTKTNKDKITTTINLPDYLEAPLKAKQQVGEMNALLNGKVVASTALVVNVEIAEAGFFSRTWQRISLWFKGLF